MLVAIVAALIAALVIGYLFYQRQKAKPAQDAINATNAEAARKLDAYLKFCADNNLTPYEDMALYRKMLAP